MQFGRRFTMVAAAALMPLMMAGCGQSGSMPRPGAMPYESVGGTGVLTSAFVAPDSAPKVAGTYKGSYSETIGVSTIKGTVTITIAQSGKNITGSVDPTINGEEFKLGLKGTVASGKHGPKLKFTIINPSGRNAAAKATLSGKKLDGTGYVAPSGSHKAVYIKFDTTKT